MTSIEEVPGMASVIQHAERVCNLPVVPLDLARVAVLDRVARARLVFQTHELTQLLAGTGSTGDTALWQELRQMIEAPVEEAERGTRLRVLVVPTEGMEKQIAELIRMLPTALPDSAAVDFWIESHQPLLRWEVILKIASAIHTLPGNRKIPATIRVVIPPPCPPLPDRVLDAIVRSRIEVCVALGQQAGYPGDFDETSERLLKSLADFGWRVPVLFYYGDEDAPQVRSILSLALRHNRTSGIGLLPASLSPRAPMHEVIKTDRQRLLGAIELLYRDPYLSEFLLEPVREIERRLEKSRSTRYVHLYLDERGYRQFAAFPALAQNMDPLSPDALHQYLVGDAIPKLDSRCATCAWSHLCGGMDAAPESSIAAQAFCSYRTALFRQIVGETIAVYEAMERRHREGVINEHGVR